MGQINWFMDRFTEENDANYDLEYNTIFWTVINLKKVFWKNKINWLDVVVVVDVVDVVDVVLVVVVEVELAVVNVVLTMLGTNGGKAKEKDRKLKSP